MRKIVLGLVVSVVFYFSPIIVNNAKSWGSDPLDKCMTRVIKGTFNGDEDASGTAAKLCQGANESTEKCMTRVIKGTFNGDEDASGTAAKLCLGN